MGSGARDIFRHEVFQALYRFRDCGGRGKLAGTAKESDSKALKVLVHYTTTESEIIYVKTGISGVSAEAAMSNSGR